MPQFGASLTDDRKTFTVQAQVEVKLKRISLVERVFTEVAFHRRGISPNALRGGFSPNALWGW